MILTVVDFQGEQDAHRVKEYLKGRAQWRSLPDYWTTGKSPVGTFHTIFDSPSSNHMFWQDDHGSYRAHLWFHSEPIDKVAAQTNSWRLHIHPEFKTSELAHSMIAVVEKRRSTLADGIVAPIETVAYESDEWLISILEEHDYTKQEALEVRMQRSLEGPIDEPSVPVGYALRPLDADTDLVERAGVQSDAFASQVEPDEWAIENTKRFLRWYEGRDDLDLVAVSENGEIASFAVFLTDPTTMVGELDPVGTRRSHQRKGLSNAVLLSGLRYLQTKGMKHAIVRTGVANRPAIQAYESVGFEVTDHLYRYARFEDLPCG